MAQIFQAAINSFFGTLHAAREKFAQDWGENIDWMPFDVHALYKAKKQGKIVMAVVQDECCEESEKLKKIFRCNNQVHKLASHFIMTNVDSRQVLTQQEFHPDGRYTPRVLFFDSSGRLMPSVKRDSSLKTEKYFYNSERPLLITMKKVLKNPHKYIMNDKYADIVSQKSPRRY